MRQFCMWILPCIRLGSEAQQRRIHGWLADKLCECQERLENLGEGIPPLLILPIYSQLPSDLQASLAGFLAQNAATCV